MRGKPGGPVGGKEQPLARREVAGGGGATGSLGSPGPVHAAAPRPPDYPSRRWPRWGSEGRREKGLVSILEAGPRDLSALGLSPWPAGPQE